MAMSFAQIFAPVGASNAPDMSAPSAPAPNQQAPATPANPADPFSKSTTPDPVPQQTAPLDQYKDLFTIDPNREVTDPNAPFITYDEKLLGEKVAEMQFVDPAQMAELATKAAQGDAAALMTLLNATAQSAYSQGAKLSANISNRAAHAGAQQVRGQMPESVRSHLASSELATLNPALSHPAISKQAQETLAAFEQKFPSATPVQLAKYTNDYFKSVFEATTSQNVNDTRGNRNGPPPIQGSDDFTDFFGRGSRR